MDKNTAINLIESTFNQAFDETRFEMFAKNFLNDVEPKSNSYSGQYIWDDYKEHVNTYKRIGKYIDPDGEALDILIVEVKSVLKLERARTALRNFVIKHLVKFEKDYALVAFYSKQDDGADWRFSFIKLEHQAFIDEEKGKVKTRKEFTPAKRYSFLVGKYEKAYTAKNQLLPVLQNVSSNATIEEIEGAFSIEKVTDEFFSQYKDLFVKLYEHFENDAAIQNELVKSKIDTSRFTKKLLGQIVFLYFLQKKGWLGVPKDKTWGNGEKRFMQQLFDTSKTENKNFFKDYLQYLFYEALAKERDNVNSYYAKFECRIPFLNGGLFEAEYDWKNANISIPETIFRNEEKNKSGDIGTGILDVFDRYNFTIKEDEPLDKEVAVDPEMLGKVFENMLEVTERKSKGAFYTPREIVHYMCQESLIHYLDNSLNNYTETFQEIGDSQTNMFGNAGKKGQHTINLTNQDIKVPKTDIEHFIRNGHFALEHDQRVVNKGKETAEYKYILPESIRLHANLIDKKLTEIKICDPAIGSGAFPVGLLHELVNAHLVIKPHLSLNYLAEKLKAIKGENNGDELSESRYIYRLKRHIIQESIYGVDIDASAIDIARLRLWLSLVVDEDDFEPIETLPNLDYKIVCGNSLIGMPSDIFPDLEKQKEIENLKPLFYNETNEAKKKELRKQINYKIRELLDSIEHFAGHKIDFDFKLFFSEVWHEKGGFDVVIGNPPYVDIKQLPPQFVRFLFQTYKSTENRINLYSIFIEHGFSLCNKKGSLVYINPNSMLLNSSYKKLRTQLVDNVILVIKLPDNVFIEADVETIIIHFSKNANYKNVRAQFFRNNEPISFDKLMLMNFERLIWKNDIEKRFNIFANPQQFNVINKVEKDKNILGLFYDFCLGITPYDKAKGHTPEQIKKRIYHSNKKKDETYVPLISGSNIRRFFVDNNSIDEYLSYGNWLGAQRKDKFFKEKRVIVRQIISGKPLKIYAGYTEHELYHTQIGFSIISKENSPFTLKIVCGYLNSEVINFYHKYKFLDIEKNTFQKILIENCKKFPLPQINDFAFNTIEKIIDYCITITPINGANLLINFFEEINNAVFYELYFPTELQSANKEIIKHLGDLKPITDSMSDEEKLAVIQSEFERLYDPNHPVRNNLETLDSIEEVRIIKEALK